VQPIEFAYHRSLAPMMWVFFALALLEMIVVHFFVGLFWPWVAIALSLVSLAGVVWIGPVIASFKNRPVAIADDALTMRCGTLKSLTVQLDNIAGYRTEWTGDAVRAPSLLNLALIAYPNIIVDLRTPAVGRVAGRNRTVVSIAHRFDDLPLFTAALDRMINKSIET
jgi:hypothetical protein